MKKPLIGITIYGRDEINHFHLPAGYIEAVVQAGGIPYLLAPCDLPTQEVLAPLDGLILSGGGDIDPKIYNGSSHEALYEIDAERDQFEIKIAHEAVKSNFPTLGICRGIQLINIAEGGTIHEHLPDVYGDEVRHRLAPRDATPHEILVEKDTGLYNIVKRDHFMVSSSHHQAINQLAPRLVATAFAPDKVIEAIEMPDHRFLMGVQWHPEHDAHNDPVQQSIFSAFIDACRD